MPNCRQQPQIKRNMAKKGGQQRKAIYDFIKNEMGVDVEIFGKNHKELKSLLLDYVNEMTSDYQKRLTDFNNELPKSTKPKEKFSKPKSQFVKVKQGSEFDSSGIGVWRPEHDKK